MAGSAHVCLKCSDNFIVKSRQIACFYCENSYHLNCVQIKDNTYKAISDSDNLVWFCDECKIWAKERLSLEKKLDKISQQTKQVCQMLQNPKSEQKENQSWSNVVRKNFPPLIIRPKNHQDGKTTEKAVTQKIKPSELSAEVNKMKKVGKGSVIIECQDSESLKKLQNKAVVELSDDYDIQIAKKINPKVLIPGIQSEYISDDEFVRWIKNQTCLDQIDDREKANVKIVRKYVPKNKKHYNIIVEVPPIIFQKLVATKRIFIEWSSHAVYEYVGVLRCYKCWKFGHKAGECRQVSDVCPMCNQNHSSKECRASSHECTNCKYAHEVLKIPNITYNHTALDKNCTSFKRMQDRIRNRTQYI